MPLVCTQFQFFQDGAVNDPGAPTGPPNQNPRYFVNCNAKLQLRMLLTNDNTSHGVTGQYRLLCKFLDNEGVTSFPDFQPVTTTSEVVKIFNSPHTTDGEIVAPADFIFVQDPCYGDNLSGVEGAAVNGRVSETGLTASFTIPAMSWAEIIFPIEIDARKVTCFDLLQFSFEFVGTGPPTDTPWCGAVAITPFQIEVDKHLCPEACACCPYCCPPHCVPETTHMTVAMTIEMTTSGTPDINLRSVDIPMPAIPNGIGWQGTGWIQTPCYDTGIVVNLPGLGDCYVGASAYIYCCNGNSGRCPCCLLRNIHPYEDQNNLGTPANAVGVAIFFALTSGAPVCDPLAAIVEILRSPAYTFSGGSEPPTYCPYILAGTSAVNARGYKQISCTPFLAVMNGLPAAWTNVGGFVQGTIDNLVVT